MQKKLRLHPKQKALLSRIAIREEMIGKSNYCEKVEKHSTAI